MLIFRKFQEKHILFQKKDVELDKIHTLYKQTSQKLETMNDVIRKNQGYEAKLRDSELQIQRLSFENSEKEEKLKSIEESFSQISSESSGVLEIRHKSSELYENIVRERDELKAQLCKISGVENLLKKLKKRADEADELEQKVECLKRELQQCGYGAAGDKGTVNRVKSCCKQCQEYSVELDRTNYILGEEIKKCNKSQAEVNFLRARVRTIDVMEAELILYKVILWFF